MIGGNGPGAVGANQAGTHFGGTARFRLDRLLGRGATGVVYAALDRDHSSTVALKLLTHLSPEGIAHFKNEFRALQDVRHRNLVELRELSVEAGHWFLIMELVNGLDLLSYVRGANVTLERASHVRTIEASPTDETIQPWETPEKVAGGAAVREHGFDETRLRSAFSQLALGLCALHGTGKIHRDLKPSNVLVDEYGRVVIVDFGLVTGVEAGNLVRAQKALGTPRYMSPEQAALGSVGPASDWFSVGVLLYEALTGSSPFDLRAAAGEPGARPAASDPRHVRADAPSDLSELCLALLSPVAEARPSGAQVLERCCAGRATASAELSPLGGGFEGRFVGRSAEIERLDAALRRVRSGEAFTVVIEGESGVGKTSLSQRFIERLRESEPSARCFTGRCYERESLPYKAIDGLMDAVCTDLSRRTQAELARVLLPSAAIVGQAFPVLRRLAGMAETARSLRQVEPHLERLRVFAALRELFARLAAEQATVIVLDDMQWSDVDSLALLSALMKPPDAPRLLWVLAKRPGGSLAQLKFPGAVEHIALGNLTQAESADLVESLLGSDEHAEQVQALTRDAGGHPLFVRELVRQFATPHSARGAPVRLDDALWQRIEQLDDPARRFMALTAVAGRPIAQSTLADALELLASSARPAPPGEAAPQPADVAAQLTALRHACLIRTGGSRASDWVETYHDRIREAVMMHLAPSQRRQSHQALAQALLRTPSPDAEALAIHLQEAGETKRAREFAILAAEQARRALAFERAARLYRLSLELGPIVDWERRDLLSQLAEALANAGRGSEAADAYQAAGLGDDTPLGLHRQRLAAEQLLRSGHIRSGITAVAKVLGKLDVASPRSNAGALLSLLAVRARLKFRGFSFAERPSADVSALESARIDGLWTAATCLTMFDNVRSAELQCRGILRALELGTLEQVLRAHTAESIFLATAGAPNRQAIERVLAAASELAARLHDPYAQGWVSLSRGATSFLLGHWQQGEAHCAAAEATFQQRAGALWELGSARAFGTWSAMMRGSFGEVSLRVPRYVEEAERRGDLYAATMQMTGFSNAAWLAVHDVAGARRMLGLAEQRWPGTEFDVPRYLNMVAAACIELYEGAGAEAHARVVRDWAALRWGIAFRAQITRFGMRTIRGLSALAAYDERPSPSLLRDARACGRAINAEHVTWSECFGHLIQAGVALRVGDTEHALAHLGHAEDRAERTGMLLHRAVIRARRGQLLGGDAGRALLSETREFMANERIAEPSQMSNMLSAPFPV